jgi:hypothetical protein
MKKPIAGLLAIAISSAFSGCSPTISPQTQQQPSSTASYPPRVKKSSTAARAEVAAKSKPSAQSPASSQASVPATTPANATPAAVTSVTLADDDAQKSRTEKLLNDSDTRLAKIDRSRLTADGASTYDQAQQLTLAARRALGDRDYALASGLAEKASLLANTIVLKSH